MMNFKHFNLQEIDTLKEIINIGIGKSADKLSKMTGSAIKLEVPNLFILEQAEFLEKIGSKKSNIVASTLKFTGEVSGHSLVLFTEKNAHLISQYLNENSENKDKTINEDILAEIGNILLNAVIGSMANILHFSVKMDIAKYIPEIKTFFEHSENMNSGNFILVSVSLFIVGKKNIDGRLALILNDDAAPKIHHQINKILNGTI